MTNHELSLQDKDCLAFCLALSARHLGLTGANPSVAAVLATPTKIIDATITAVGGRPHAEELLLARNPSIPPSATLYLSLEPCAHPSPHRATCCADAIATNNIKRIVIAVLDPNPKTHGAGVAAIKKSGAMVLLADEPTQAMARKIHQGFFHAMEKHRPLVAAKIALSADGVAIPPTGQPRQITRGQLQFFSQYIRCRYDGLLVSAKTILQDDPQLTIRARGLPTMQRPRFVIDAKNSASGKEQVFCKPTQQHQPLVIFVPEKNKNLPSTATQIILPTDNHHRFAWPALLAAINDLKINRLLIETGGGLATSLKAAHLLDELWLCQQHDVFLNNNHDKNAMTTLTDELAKTPPRDVFAFDNNSGTAKKYELA